MKHFRLVFVIQLVRYITGFEYKSFGCDCGYFKNQVDSNPQSCQNKKQDQDGFSVKSKHPFFQSRIVGGYNVEKHCFKRPSLAYIRIKHKSREFWGECMGSIINKKFIITSAHCFCSPMFGKCQENNGKVTRKTSKSGHPKYSKGNIESESDPNIINNVKIIIPGLAESYSKDLLHGISNLQNHVAVKRAKKIIIHPEFVFSQRETNDIALIEIESEFNFDSPLDLSPICLSEKRIKGVEVPVFVTGYGQVFEGTVEKTGCNTGFGGPSEFEPCGKFYVSNDEVYDHSTECNLNDSPTARDPDCQALHVARPDTVNKKVIIHLPYNKIVHCFPLKGLDTKGWCSTCKQGAEMGEPGYCNDNQDIDFITDEEISMREDISPSEGWGFCDDNCFSTQVFKNELQEAELTTLKDEDCLELTEKYKNDAGFLYKRPDIDLELCASKKYSWNILHFQFDNGRYELIKNETQSSYGGSDSCKGDSGGPLWMTFKDQAFLVGITNRGTGCARKNNVGIYARISHHWDWIHEVASSGACFENYSQGLSSTDQTLKSLNSKPKKNMKTKKVQSLRQLMDRFKGRKRSRSRRTRRKKSRNDRNRKNLPASLFNHFKL